MEQLGNESSYGSFQVSGDAAVERHPGQAVSPQEANTLTHETEEMQLSWTRAPDSRGMLERESLSFQSHQLSMSDPPHTNHSESSNVTGQPSSTPGTVPFDTNWMNEPLYSVTQGLDTYYESMESVSATCSPFLPQAYQVEALRPSPHDWHGRLRFCRFFLYGLGYQWPAVLQSDNTARCFQCR